MPFGTVAMITIGIVVRIPLVRMLKPLSGPQACRTLAAYGFVRVRSISMVGSLNRGPSSQDRLLGRVGGVA